MLTSTGFS